MNLSLGVIIIQDRGNGPATIERPFAIESETSARHGLWSFHKFNDSKYHGNFYSILPDGAI